MGSPLKHLFQPRILFPLSPITPSKRTVINKHRNSPIQGNITSGCNLAKTLIFQVSPNNTHQKHLSAQKIDSRPNIKIKVTDYDRSLLINTPNKSNLMKNGLNSTKDLNILGKGSFGTVVCGIYKGRGYKIRQMGSSTVAVKIVKLKGNNLASLRESNALQLNHENVTKIIDIIHNQNTNYGIILMEHIKFSRQLQSILNDQNVNLYEKMIVKYGLDVCRGLYYCHENGVLHLDIKPSNILVCEGDLCKLCDFGNSVKVNEDSDWNAHQCTVAYAAPEILIGKPPTTKCDVYSLGIVLWQMKYREIPYSELDGIEVIVYKVVKFGYRPNIPKSSIVDEYQFIYSSCWAGNPIDRPPLSSVFDTLSTISLVI